MSLIHNERTKLSATGINTVASAAVIAGTITPLVALLYGFGSTTLRVWVAVLISMSWILVGGVLHFCARAILGRLKP